MKTTKSHELRVNISGVNSQLTTHNSQLPDE